MTIEKNEINLKFDFPKLVCSEDTWRVLIQTTERGQQLCTELKQRLHIYIFKKLQNILYLIVKFYTDRNCNWKGLNLDESTLEKT